MPYFLLTLCALCAGCTFNIVTEKPGIPPAESAAVSVVAPQMTFEEIQQWADNNRWCLSRAEQVMVVNTSPIVAKDAKAKAVKSLTDDTQKFSFGDSCRTEGSGLFETVGVLEQEGVVRVLVRYWDEAGREAYDSCPSYVAFFADWEDYWKHCTITNIRAGDIKETAKKKKATVLAELWAEQEKARVKTLLGEQEQKK